MAVTITINGAKELQAALRNLPKNLAKKADKVIESNVRDMVLNSKQDAPKDFGRLQGAIVAKKNGEVDWSMVCQVDYAVYLEFGTKGNYQPIPGVDPSEFKSKGGGSGKGFYDSILAWVKRKGLGDSYDIKTRRRTDRGVDRQIRQEQTAFAIYLSIMRHGIKPQPFFFKQGPRQEPRLNAAFQQLINEQRL